MRKKVMFLLYLRKSKIAIISLCFISAIFTIFLVDYHWEALSNKIKEKIIVDPGHGGIDGGANNGQEFLEKDVNLKIATYLKKELEKEGKKAILTRESDTQLDHLNEDSSSRHKRDLLARVQIINANQPALFVSIHVNANKKRPQTDGPIVFYFQKSEDGKRLGTIVLNKLNQFTNKYDVQGAREPIGTEKFFILRNSSYPGILVEVGFLTNQQEKELLLTEEYQKGLAHAISLGINEFLKSISEKKTN